MTLNYREIEVMAGPSAGLLPSTSNPLREVEGSIEVQESVDNDGGQRSDDCPLIKLSPEDMSWIEEYASQCTDTVRMQLTSGEQHQRLNKVLCIATLVASKGKGMKLVDKLCGKVNSWYHQRATLEDDALGTMSPDASRTYEDMLTILCSPSGLPLSLVALLLWLLADCKLYMSNITFSADRLSGMCFQIFKYLDDIAPEIFPLTPSGLFEKGIVCQEHQAFSLILNILHGVACWGLSNYGGVPEFALVRDSLSKLQVDVWERLISMGFRALACTAIGEAIQATLVPRPNSVSSPSVDFKYQNQMVISMNVLEEKKIIRRLLLCGSYQMHHVSPVKKFLTILGLKGVVVKEDVFLWRMILCALRPPVPPTTMENCNVADLINATMLKVLDISGYTNKFLKHALKWSETRQVDNSVLSGSRILGILRKLLKVDKPKRWENRFFALFRKHGAEVPDSLLLNCLKEAADHYSTSHVHDTGPMVDMQTSLRLLRKDRQAKLLQACSSADIAFFTDIAIGTLNHKKIEKVEFWKEKEIDLDVRMDTSSSLLQALSKTFPYTRHETAKKCLERLALAQHLSVDLNPDKSKTTFVSVIATAMSPELQALEALEDESLLHCIVVQQVEELREKHEREYEALKQEQYGRLVEFAEICRKEKDDMVWVALKQKAKVMASVDRACAGKADADVSSEDILKRLFLNAGSAYQQMEVKLSQMKEKHEASLERIPNVECAICYSKFSLKRKRACLDPCGHTSTCVDCATQEWKRTKKCSFCKSSIEKPIAVPFKLFF